jgi:uncharacterized protein
VRRFNLTRNEQSRRLPPEQVLRFTKFLEQEIGNMSTALITGASSGIGAAFAEALAKRGVNVVLVARSEDRLLALANTLNSQHGIRADVIVQDLTQPDSTTLVYKAIATLGLEIDLLINNAGFGDYGVFCDRPRQKQLDMIQLNISALVDLTHQFLPQMQQRRSGSILNVASIAGFQPMPYFSVYAATKAFVLSFSEALWAENQSSGVHIMAACPGPTESRFFEVADFPNTLASPGQGIVSAAVVVQEALQALENKQPNVVTGGISNQIVVNAARFLPRQTLVNGIAKVFRPKSIKSP